MANYILENGELKHYGVPGMKWGVRKARPTSSENRWPFGLMRKKKPVQKEAPKEKPIKKRKLSELSDKEIEARIARIDLEKRYIEAVKGKKVSKSIKEQPTKDKSAKNVKKKKLSELTNEELQAKVDRLQLEKRYRELAKEVNPPKSTEGRDYALDIIKNIGKNSLTNIGSQAATKALGVIINKACGVDPYDTTKRIVNPNKGQSDKK